jgi:hypothetical protein
MSGKETVELEFVISQRAKGDGGDKYICSTNPKFNIYMPQSISRKNGVVIEKMQVAVTPF